MSGWGWNPETFSAIGTVGATLVGSVALLIASSQVKMAGRDLAMRAQARQVHVRILKDSMMPRAYPATSSAEHSGHWVSFARSTINATTRVVDVEILNASQGHISLHCLASVGGWPVEGEAGYGTMTRTSWRGSYHGLAFTKNTVAPGERNLLRIPVADEFMYVQHNMGVQFQDSEGNTWTRSLDGMLIRGEMKPRMRA